MTCKRCPVQLLLGACRCSLTPWDNHCERCTTCTEGTQLEVQRCRSGFLYAANSDTKCASCKACAPNETVLQYCSLANGTDTVCGKAPTPLPAPQSAYQYGYLIGNPEVVSAWWLALCILAVGVGVCAATAASSVSRRKQLQQMVTVSSASTSVSEASTSTDSESSGKALNSNRGSSSNVSMLKQLQQLLDLTADELTAWRYYLVVTLVTVAIFVTHMAWAFTLVISGNSISPLLTRDSSMPTVAGAAVLGLYGASCVAMPAITLLMVLRPNQRASPSLSTSKMALYCSYALLGASAILHPRLLMPLLSAPSFIWSPSAPAGPAAYASSSIGMVLRSTALRCVCSLFRDIPVLCLVVAAHWSVDLSVVHSDYISVVAVLGSSLLLCWDTFAVIHALRIVAKHNRMSSMLSTPSKQHSHQSMVDGSVDGTIATVSGISVAEPSANLEYNKTLGTWGTSDSNKQQQQHPAQLSGHAEALDGIAAGLAVPRHAIGSGSVLTQAAEATRTTAASASTVIVASPLVAATVEMEMPTIRKKTADRGDTDKQGAVPDAGVLASDPIGQHSGSRRDRISKAMQGIQPQQVQLLQLEQNAVPLAHSMHAAGVRPNIGRGSNSADASAPGALSALPAGPGASSASTLDARRKRGLYNPTVSLPYSPINGNDKLVYGAKHQQHLQQQELRSHSGLGVSWYQAAASQELRLSSSSFPTASTFPLCLPPHHNNGGYSHNGTHIYPPGLTPEHSDDGDSNSGSSSFSPQRPRRAAATLNPRQLQQQFTHAHRAHARPLSSSSAHQLHQSTSQEDESDLASGLFARQHYANTGPQATANGGTGVSTRGGRGIERILADIQLAPSVLSSRTTTAHAVETPASSSTGRPRSSATAATTTSAVSGSGSAIVILGDDYQHPRYGHQEQQQRQHLHSTAAAAINAPRSHHLPLPIPPVPVSITMLSHATRVRGATPAQSEGGHTVLSVSQPLSVPSEFDEAEEAAGADEDADASGSASGSKERAWRPPRQ